MTRLRNRLARFIAPKSLRLQLLSRSLLILSVLLMLIGLFQYVIMKQFLYQNKADSIRTQMMRIAREPWMGTNSPPLDGDGAKHRDRADRPAVFIPDSKLGFVDLEGDYEPLSEPAESESPPQLSKQEYLEMLQGKENPAYRIVRDDAGKPQLLVFEPVGLPGHRSGLLQVSTRTEQLENVLFRQLLTFLGLAALALIFGLAAFLPVLRRTLVPLSNMVRTVEKIDAGSLDERLPVQQGQLEVDRLARSFNGMLERLETSFHSEKEAKEQMRRFIADASHELRTPLTSIHGFLEILLRGAANHPEQLEQSLKSMYGESGRINKLVDDLLLLTKLDQTPVLDMRPGSLEDVIEEMEPQLRMLAGTRQVNLHLSRGMICRFDKDKMKQVVLNLFQNAVKHTDAENGKIELLLSREGEDILLAVRDNGVGIEAEHLSRIFERFYRIDTSRARKHGGAGLGLSITASIVEIHGGTLRAESRPGEGSIFTVRLPS